MRKFLFFVLILGFVVAASAFGQNYRGTYTSTSGGATLTLVLEQDATGRISGTLSSTKGTRFRLEGKIQEGIATGNCSGPSGQSYFEAEFEDNKLIFTLVEVNASGETTSPSFEFIRLSGSGAKAAPQAPSAPMPRSEATPKPPGPADASLMKYFAGEYYSYSSGSTLSGGAGTERTVTLCPDGLYRDSYEFSASGSGWGGANSQRGAARWSIQGDKSRGTITVTYANGQTKRFSYQVASKNEGTILFDGVRFAFAGAPKCR